MCYNNKIGIFRRVTRIGNVEVCVSAYRVMRVHHAGSGSVLQKIKGHVALPSGPGYLLFCAISHSFTQLNEYFNVMSK